jgi:hypothetical protein
MCHGHRQVSGDDRSIGNSLQTRIVSASAMPIDRLDAAALSCHVIGVPEIDHDDDDGRNFKPRDDTYSQDDQDRDDKVRNPALPVICGGVIPKIERISGEIVRAADQGRGSKGHYPVFGDRRNEQQGKTSQWR